MRFDTIDGVRETEFIGFKTASELRKSNFAEVLDVPGVYMVVRDPSAPPVFSERSTGGHFKGKDPTVAIEVLERNWVKGAATIYIGKAGGGSSSATLRRRLKSFLRFGEGHPIGHWGGRFVWQLQDADSHLFCWKQAGNFDARLLESDLIRDFVRIFGTRPFANLRD